MIANACVVLFPQQTVSNAHSIIFWTSRTTTALLSALQVSITIQSSHLITIIAESVRQGALVVLEQVSTSVKVAQTSPILQAQSSPYTTKMSLIPHAGQVAP